VAENKLLCEQRNGGIMAHPKLAGRAFYGFHVGLQALKTDARRQARRFQNDKPDINAVGMLTS